MDFDNLEAYLDQLENQIMFDITEIKVSETTFDSSNITVIDNRSKNEENRIIERSVE